MLVQTVPLCIPSNQPRKDQMDFKSILIKKTQRDFRFYSLSAVISCQYGGLYVLRPVQTLLFPNKILCSSLVCHGRKPCYLSMIFQT